jgi:hypothetical protein
MLKLNRLPVPSAVKRGSIKLKNKFDVSVLSASRRRYRKADVNGTDEYSSAGHRKRSLIHERRTHEGMKASVDRAYNDCA